MLRIAESNNSKVVFLLHPRNYNMVYSGLKNLLSPQQLLLFARPDLVGNITKWSTELPDSQGVVIKELSQLPKEEIDGVADDLEDQKAAVMATLSKTKEFEGIVQHLLIVPDETSIKAIKTDKGWVPVLTQWGCRSNETLVETDPVSSLIRRPRTTTAQVNVFIFYSDGTPAASKEFYIEYFGHEIKERTNKEGQYARGRCKLDTEFTVYDLVDGKHQFIHSFTVKNDTEYIVTFPFITIANLKVIDQKAKAIADTLVTGTYKEAEVSYNTGKTGNIQIENLEAGQTITLAVKEHPESNQTFTIEREGNEFVLHLTLPVPSRANVKVVDGENNIQPHYPVLLDYDGTQKQYTTGESGILILDKLEAGKQISVTDKNRIDNFISATLLEADNELILNITREAAKFVTVKLLDPKSKPMPGIPIDFTYNGQTKREVTNTNGICILPFEGFVDKQKVKTFIHLPKKEKVKK